MSNPLDGVSILDGFATIWNAIPLHYWLAGILITAVAGGIWWVKR